MALIGFVLALYGFVLFSRKASFISVIYCMIGIYVHFGFFGDWLCFGFDWVCFDQVSNLIYFRKSLYYKTLSSFAIRLRRIRLGLFCIKRVDL